MTELDISSKATALLIMDCQEGVLVFLTQQEKEKVLTNVRSAIQVARAASIPVIYVVVQFREGYPEISDRNLRFKQVKEGNRLKRDLLIPRYAKRSVPNQAILSSLKGE